MKNKKLIFAVIGLVVVLALLMGLYLVTRPGAVLGPKNITVTVVHKDGTEKTFEYFTYEEYLAPVLVKEGLIVESASDGMYTTVDGELADWSIDQGWWEFFIGEESAIIGMEDAPLHDGDTFKLVYRVGYDG